MLDCLLARCSDFLAKTLSVKLHCTKSNRPKQHRSTPVHWFPLFWPYRSLWETNLGLQCFWGKLLFYNCFDVDVFAFLKFSSSFFQFGFPQAPLYNSNNETPVSKV